jgi:hypothetical protein
MKTGNAVRKIIAPPSGSGIPSYARYLLLAGFPFLSGKNSRSDFDQTRG